LAWLLSQRGEENNRWLGNQELGNGLRFELRANNIWKNNFGRNSSFRRVGRNL
jgi:hypothetical protein